ncbi:MAG: T9SS type A sorting domain-containing protein [Bacteroidia bacterium]
MTYIFTGILIALSTFNLIAQSFFFEKKLGDLLPDLARDIVQYPDSSIYILGTTIFPNNAQVTLTKTDALGNSLWVKYYGGIYNDYGISLLSLNNELIIAYEKETSPNNIDIGIIKTDTSGNILFTSTFGINTKNESPRQLIATLDGNYVLCGFISDNHGYNDIYVIKFDNNGNEIWSLSAGGNNNDYASGITQLPDSSYLVSGDTKSYSMGGYDVYLVKLDKNGNILWDKTYGDSYDNGSQGILYTSDNLIFVYGETHTGINLDFDYFTLFTDTAGIQIGQYNLGGNGTDAAFSAIETANGNFILTGYSNTFDTLKPIHLSVFEININGNILWQKYYGGEGIDIGYKIIQSNMNGILIVGQNYDTLYDTQQYLLHLNYNGTLTNFNLHNKINTTNKFYPYPNPFYDKIFLPNYNEIEAIEITNSIGQILIHQTNLSSYIDCTSLLSGWYFLKIIKNNETWVYKIIKQ